MRLRKVEKTTQTLCNWIIFLLFNFTENDVDKQCQFENRLRVLAGFRPLLNDLKVILKVYLDSTIDQITNTE